MLADVVQAPASTQQPGILPLVIFGILLVTAVTLRIVLARRRLARAMAADRVIRVFNTPIAQRVASDRSY